MDAVPALGQHARDILTELGYSDEQIQQYADQGII
jgi:crotonobetainyl-CoA:carnitine CoA-transferase CaiB-like acyl-CoA transferase